MNEPTNVDTNKPIVKRFAAPAPNKTNKRTGLIVFLIILGLGGYAGMAVQAARNNEPATVVTSRETSTKTGDVAETVEIPAVKAEEVTQDYAAQVNAYNTLSKKYEDALATIAEIQAAANKPVTQLDQTKLDLKIEDSVTTFYTNYNMSMLGINITFTNNTKSTIKLSQQGFQLRDKANHLFTYTNGGQGYGFVALSDATLKPGESVTGSIGFNVEDDDILDYTLINGDNTYPVKATKSNKEWPLN